MTTEYWIFKLMQALSVVNLYHGIIDDCVPTFCSAAIPAQPQIVPVLQIF